MFCRKCGQTIKEGEQYCHSCGTLVEVTSPKAFDPATTFKPAGLFKVADDLDDMSNSRCSIELSSAIEDAAKEKFYPTSTNKIPTSFWVAGDLDDKDNGKRLILPSGSTKKYIKRGAGIVSSDTCVKAEEKTETIIFERSVRLKSSVEEETFLIPSPPIIGDKPKIDYLSTFLPAIITVSIGVVMFLFMGNIASLIYSLPMSLSGVIMSVQL